MFLAFAASAIVGIAILGSLFACFYVGYKRAPRTDDSPA
jgi:hypothetical protein